MVKTHQSSLQNPQELNLTWDSASWDMGCSSFLRAPKDLGGFGANGEERDCDYHALWNAFNWVLDQTTVKYSCMQMLEPQLDIKHPFAAVLVSI